MDIRVITQRGSELVLRIVDGKVIIVPPPPPPPPPPAKPA